MKILSLSVLLILAFGTEGREINEKRQQLIEEIETLLEYERSTDTDSRNTDSRTVYQGVVIPMPSFKCYHSKDDYMEQTVKDTSLYAHNVLRERSNIPIFTWDDVLAEGCQNWSNHMAQLKSLVHSPDHPDYVENISYQMAPMNATCYGSSLHTQKWYNEISAYDFTTNSGPGTGHFTAMMWKSSNKLGCAMSLNVDGANYGTYYCCRYSPGGNINSNTLYELNVIEPDSKDAVEPWDLEEPWVAGGDEKCDYSPKCKRYRNSCPGIKDACPKKCAEQAGRR